MPYAAVNNIQMYYEEAGRGSPLVLLHGGTGAIDFEGVTSWAGLMPGFAARYRAIHLDSTSAKVEEGGEEERVL